MTSCATNPSQSPLPPVAARQDYTHFEHGVARPDPWHWLRDRDDAEVIRHLEAENAYTEAMMQPVAGLVDQLYAELVGRIEEDDHSAPFEDGSFLYRSRIRKGQEHRVYERKPRYTEGVWEVYFDTNAEAKGYPYFDLGFLEISPDGRWLAYSMDTSGDEVFSLHFRDLNNGRDLRQVVKPVSDAGEWTADSRAFLYLVEDDAKRPYRIYHYSLDSHPADSQLVYEESDPLYFASLYKSQDRNWLFAYSTSKETNEIWCSPAASGTDFSLMFPRQAGIRYWPEHHSGRWLLHTNRNAPDFQLLAVPVGATTLDEAEVIMPPRPGVRLREVVPLRDFIVFIEREDGMDQISIYEIATGELRRIPTPESVYALHEGENCEFDTTVFDFVYSSPVRPQTVYRFNLLTGESSVLDVSVVPSGHRPEDYEVHRIHATATDGTAVPMTVIHRRGLPLDGTRPAFLYGYGAYGDTMEPAFSRIWLTWLQRDFTVAIAHVRGGGLLGEEWYQAGKMLAKPNSFTDFVACADQLVADRYTSHDQLVIEGASAGGLLIGAVLNLRPDICRAALAGVPFVDVLNTMFDASLPLTTFEYEEWGDPNVRAAFDTIRGYSPYDNVRPLPYPAILATAGLNDPRVPYWEAAKWVAKLRANSTSSQPILLKTNMDSGHSGASGRYSYLRETAFEQAFLLNILATSNKSALE